MLTGTPLANEFSSKLNQVLESMGSASKMILLQQRLRKVLEKRTAILNEIKQIQTDLINRIKLLHFDTPESIIKSYFQNLTNLKPLDKEPITIPQLNATPDFSNVFTNLQLKLEKDRLNDCWNSYQIMLNELQHTLVEVLEYFESVVKNANLVTSELFSRGFQASIPGPDVQRCELAGIHIKNITATSCTMKTSISDEYFDVKLKTQRKLEEVWNEVESIVSSKSQEEAGLINFDVNQKPFTELHTTIKILLEEWHKIRMFDCNSEENVLIARILQGAFEIFSEVNSNLKIVSKVHLSSETLVQFMPVIQALTPKLEQLRQFTTLSVLLREILRNLWSLNRDFAFKIGQDSELILNPAKLTDLVKDIPNVLKREMMQKLISPEIRQTKMGIFNHLTDQIEKLTLLPLEYRALIVPYQQISC
jgi:hypothetical protein